MADNQAPPPWYRWHWFDFLKSCRGWSFHQRAVYRELLDIQWQEGSLPKNPGKCRDLVGCSAEVWAEAWRVIEDKFPMRGSGRQNPRMEFERARAASAATQARDAGTRGAQARWHSQRNQEDDMGGLSQPYRVSLADKKILDLRDKNVEVRKEKILNSDLSQRSLTTHVAEATFSMPAGLNLKAWEEWRSHRKLIKKPILDHQVPKAMQALAKLGDLVAQQAAVDHSIANGWQGLFEPSTRRAGKKFRAPKSVEDLEAEEAKRNAEH